MRVLRSANTLLGLLVIGAISAATTTIEYSIPNKAKVTLKVFDIQGREVVRLVDKDQAAGAHTVNFDASNYASGIYFYQLTTDNNQALVKKMMLIK